MILDIKPTPDGGFSALQRQSVPAVYLDFCALRGISEEPRQASRFVRAMHRCSGTLLISAFSIFEFALLNDLRHAKAADAVLEQLFLNLYFINSEPFTVIAAENAAASGAPNIVPHVDGEMFRDTLLLLAQQEGPFKLATVLSALSERVRPAIEEFKLTVPKAFEALKARLEVEPQLRSNAKRALALVGNRQTATMALLYALTKPLHDDRLPSGNDVIDLLHTVVPAAYADLVVLDGKWAHATIQATQTIRKAGYTAPIAQAFSPRRNGIEEFLSVLESYPPANAEMNFVRA